MAASHSHSKQKDSVINAERILRALDSRLNHEVTLVIYGRAAIALGFNSPPEAVTKTLDVDAVIPVSQVARFRADQNFWDAQEGSRSQPAQFIIDKRQQLLGCLGAALLGAVEDARDFAHALMLTKIREHKEARK